MKLLGLALLICLLASPAMAQNTKGDNPRGREARFKVPFGKQRVKSGPGKNRKRVKSSERSSSRAVISRGPKTATRSSRPGKPIRPITSRSPQTKQRAWTGDISGRRIRNRESAGSSRNIYPQYSKYSRNPSPFPRRTENAASNKSALARLRKLEGPAPKQGGPKPRVVPRSASRSFTARKSINVYANFPRPKRKGERATTRDLAGKPLRTKNFETPKAGVIAPTFHPYAGRGKRGDKPYKGPQLGGYRSATRAGERAWTGDIAGRRVRGRNFTSKKRVEGMPTLPKHVRSASRPGESRPGRAPLPPTPLRYRAYEQGRYQNKLRGRRPSVGGGSVSGRAWNNNGQALPPRTPRQGAGAALFQGNIKGHRPLKGGGSVSGRLWNNNESPIVGRAPKQGARAAVFQGNVKGGARPFKGGGSVSGKLWNNKEKPIEGTAPKHQLRVATFQGNVRGHRPEKGGGSVSGKLWNNDEKPIEGRNPPRTALVAENLQVKVKRRNYVKNKNSADEALLKLAPTKGTYQAGDLQVKVKQPEYGKKPHAAEGAMPGIKPSRATVKASEYARSVRRRWDYIHNPSSADEALKTREPGKAFAKVQAYQGNIKMKKYALFEKNRELHPDTKFIKINKNNVDDERDMLTNFKLWWARLFKKQETQPDHLKEKGKRPRYDKGEAGMWYE